MRKGETIYTWLCGICPARFTGTDENSVQDQALNCERTGRPYEGLKAGDTVAIKSFSYQERKDRKHRIVAVGYEKLSHRPLYILQEVKTRIIVPIKYFGEELIALGQIDT